MEQIYIPPVNIANPYTYIDTISYENSSAWADAVGIISQFNSSHSGKTAEDRKTDAVQFLRSMSNQWRNNEISFINNEIVKLVSLYREEKDLSKRDQDLKKDIKELMDMMNQLQNGFNYTQFTNILNRIIKGTTTYRARLSNIKANFFDKSKFGDRGLLQNIDKEFKDITELLKGQADWINYQKKSYERTVATFIFDYINKNEDNLRAHLSDSKAFTAWLLELSTNFRVYLEKIHAEERERLNNNYRNQRKSLEENFNDFVEKEKKSLLSFEENDIKRLLTIADSLGIQKYNDDVTRAHIQLPTLSSDPKDSYDIVFTSALGPSAFDEQLGLLVRNAIQTMRQMGGSGMGNDSIGAVLNIRYNEPKYNQLIEEANKTIEQLDNSMTDFAKLRTNRSLVAEANQRMNKAIEDHLLKLDQKLEEIEGVNKAFIIHESDKYYQSMEAGFEKNWNASVGGFHGRTIAILNYIDIMNNLSKNFGLGDIETAKFVAYNLGSHSPGSNQQTISTLEEIFTYAAAMIMFDDIAIAVKEATNELKFSNVTNLHLYKLQELYFPGSYLLSQTADYLNGMRYEDTNAVTAEIQVDDNIYIANYLQLYGSKLSSDQYKDAQNRIKSAMSKEPEERWNIMRNYMASHTKVSLHFFLNFVSFINGLQ